MMEHDYEPVPGLPERLPEGETILWQGAPMAQSFARYAFHIRAVAAYFALLAVWHLADGWSVIRGTRCWACWSHRARRGAILVLVSLAGYRATTLYTITIAAS